MISNELGNARLVLNPKAKNIGGFIHRRSDVQSYLHDTIRKSFKLSRCQNLSEPIDLAVVYDLLGEAAYKLQRQDNCDLFDIELLEEVAWLIADRYSLHVAEMVEMDAQRSGREKLHYERAHKRPKPNKKAAIVSFPRFKIRKANALL